MCFFRKCLFFILSLFCLSKWHFPPKPILTALGDSRSQNLQIRWQLSRDNICVLEPCLPFLTWAADVEENSALLSKVLLSCVSGL
jgi:hypothetical protein